MIHGNVIFWKRDFHNYTLSSEVTDLIHQAPYKGKSNFSFSSGPSSSGGDLPPPKHCLHQSLQTEEWADSRRVEERTLCVASCLTSQPKVRKGNPFFKERDVDIYHPEPPLSAASSPLGTISSRSAFVKHSSSRSSNPSDCFR